MRIFMCKSFNNLIIIVTILLSSCVQNSETAVETFENKNVSRRIASEKKKSDFEALSVQMSPRIGDREYIFNVLLYVFGPSADALITSIIYNNSAAYNGSCSQYEAVYSAGGVPLNGNYIIDDAKANCNNSSLNLPVVGTENSIREGARLQACEILVNNDNTLFYAIEKEVGTVANRTTFSINPTSTTITKIYNRFYPGFAIDPVFLNNLLNISQSSQLTTSKDRFKLVLLTVCMTADWQIP